MQGLLIYLDLLENPKKNAHTEQPAIYDAKSFSHNHAVIATM